jgi:hypothetical protein
VQNDAQAPENTEPKREAFGNVEEHLFATVKPPPAGIGERDLQLRVL